MGLSELGSIFTHFPLSQIFSQLCWRIRCLWPILQVVITGAILSLLYHECKLVDGLVCLYQLDESKLQDHIGSEAILLAMAFLYAPFKRNHARMQLMQLVIFIQVLYKLKFDNLYFTMAVGAPVFLTGAPHYWRYREFHLSGIFAVIASICFFNESNAETPADKVLHCLWHFFIFESIYMALLARFRRPCDDCDCKCEIRHPGWWWTAPVKEIASYTKNTISVRIWKRGHKFPSVPKHKRKEPHQLRDVVVSGEIDKETQETKWSNFVGQTQQDQQSLTIQVRWAFGDAT